MVYLLVIMNFETKEFRAFGTNNHINNLKAVAEYGEGSYIIDLDDYEVYPYEKELALSNENEHDMEKTANVYCNTCEAYHVVKVEPKEIIRE